MSTSALVSVLVAVVVLLAVAVATSLVGRLRTERETVVVVVRAVVQLFAVAAVIRVVFATPWLAPVYLALMLGVAAATSSRRLRRRGVRGTFVRAIAAIAAGAGTTVAIVAAARAIPVDVRQIVPFTAQIIGGAMTATTLAAVRMLDEVDGQWELVEAWLALGATPKAAVTELGRRAASTALVPALDQTRNVGLVVLPGAFVGLLLAGASPLEAGRIQLLVLVGLLAAQTMAALVVTVLLASRLGTVRPGRALAPAHG